MDWSLKLYNQKDGCFKKWDGKNDRRISKTNAKVLEQLKHLEENSDPRNAVKLIEHLNVIKW